MNIGNQPISIFNMYSPNNDSKAFFQDLETHLHLDTVSARLVGGDLNTVVHAAEDRRSQGGSARAARSQISPLRTLLPNCHLEDSWRALHPEDREFTHFSHPHNSWSRIDYMLLSRVMMPFPGAKIISGDPLSIYLEMRNSRPCYVAGG